MLPRNLVIAFFCRGISAYSSYPLLAALLVLVPIAALAADESPDQKLKLKTGGMVAACCEKTAVYSDGRKMCVGTDSGCCTGESISCQRDTCEAFWPSSSQYGWCQKQCLNAESTCQRVSSSNPYPLILEDPRGGLMIPAPGGRSLDKRLGIPAPGGRPLDDKRLRVPGGTANRLERIPATARPSRSRPTQDSQLLKKGAGQPVLNAIKEGCKQRCSKGRDGVERCEMVCETPSMPRRTRDFWAAMVR